MSSAKIIEHQRYGQVVFIRSEMFKCKIYFAEESTASVEKLPGNKFIYKKTDEDEPIEGVIKDGVASFSIDTSKIMTNNVKVGILDLVSMLIQDEVYTDDNYPIHVDQSIGEGQPDPDESMTCCHAQVKNPTTETGSLNNFFAINDTNLFSVRNFSSSNDNLLDISHTVSDIQDNSYHPTFSETILSCFGCCYGNDSVEV